MPSTSTGSVASSGPDDEGHQVGGHRHGVGEAHPAPAVVERLVDATSAALDTAAGRRRHEGDGEAGLEVGLVPAREGPAGVGGLELGGGDDPLDAVVVGEGRAVEAAELVVEHAPEPQRTRPHRPAAAASARVRVARSVASSRATRGVVAASSPTVTHASSISSSMALSTTSAVGSATSTSMSTVPAKVARVEVGREREVVAAGEDRAREAMGVGHGGRLPGALDRSWNRGLGLKCRPRGRADHHPSAGSPVDTGGVDPCGPHRPGRGCPGTETSGRLDHTGSQWRDRPVQGVAHLRWAPSWTGATQHAHPPRRTWWPHLPGNGDRSHEPHASAGIGTPSVLAATAADGVAVSSVDENAGVQAAPLPAAPAAVPVVVASP